MVKGKAREEPNGATPAPPPNNKPVELTPEETFALASQWRKQVVAQRNAVKEAKADYDSEKSTLRDLYKKVKAEIGAEGLERVKMLANLEIGGETAAEALRAEIQNMTWVAQWANAFEGKQLELMPDLRPIADRAFEDGKKAGLAGDSFNPRYGQGTEAYHRFQEGWQAGQDILAKGIKPLEQPPAPLGDPQGSTPKDEGDGTQAEAGA